VNEQWPSSVLVFFAEQSLHMGSVQRSLGKVIVFGVLVNEHDDKEGKRIFKE
jgi:hypothetical protein